MIAVPGQARTSAASRSQAPAASLLQPAPGQLHQVEGGQEVGVVPVGGVEDAALAQRLAVGEEDVLDEGGAGLGGTDVQEYASGHGVPPCRRQVRRQAATASSRVRVRSTVPGCRWSDGSQVAGIAVHSVASPRRRVAGRRPPARAAQAERARGDRRWLRVARERVRSSSAAASRAASSRTWSGPCGERRSAGSPDAAGRCGRGLRRRPRSNGRARSRPAVASAASWASRATTTCTGSRRRPAEAVRRSRRRRSVPGRWPAATRATPQRRPLQDAAGAACAAAQCSAIITSTGRASTTCVGSPVGLDAGPARAAPRVRRRRCRVTRAAGSGAATGAASREVGCSWRGAGTPGSRWTSTPTASRISSSSGSRAGSMAGLPKRAAASGQGRGTSTSPRPGEAVASTRSASPCDRTPGRLVEPADQLEVDGVGEGARSCGRRGAPGRGRATPTRSSYRRSGGGQPSRPRPRRTT